MDTSGFSKLPTEIKQLIVPFSRLRDLASFRLLSPDALVATEKQSYELIKQYFPYLLVEKNHNHAVNYFELLISQFKKVYSFFGYKFTLENQQAIILKYHLAALTGDSEVIIAAPISWNFKRLLHAILIASGHAALPLSANESQQEKKLRSDAYGEYEDFCSIACRALIIAAELDNLAAVLTILKNPSVQNTRGYALVEATKNDHLSIVEALLENAPSCMLIQMNFKRDDYYDEYDARKFSIKFAIRNKNYLILKTLLENQSKYIYDSAIDGIDYNGEYYIEQAVETGDVSIVRLILQLKSSISALDSAIRKAEKKQFSEIADVIKAHASIPFAWSEAVCNNDIEAMRFLAQKGADINDSIKTNEGNCYSPLKIITQKNHRAALQELLALGFKITTYEGYEALCDAGKFGHVEIIRILVKQGGFNINQPGQNGMPLIYFTEKGYVDGARELISLGADVSILKKKNQSVLMIAAENNQIEMIKFFVLELKLKIDAQTIDGWTPLMVATIKGDIEMVQFLINELGANIYLTNGEGETPLLLAALYGHPQLIHLFSSLGASMLPPKVEGLVTSSKEERDSVCSSLRAGLHFLWPCFSTSGVANNEDKAEYGKTAGLSFTKNK